MEVWWQNINKKDDPSVITATSTTTFRETVKSVVKESCNAGGSKHKANTTQTRP